MTLATGSPEFSPLPEHFCLTPIPAPAPWEVLTCEGPEPVNLDVVPEAAPRAVEGAGRGQGRVEEGSCEWSSWVGRETRPRVPVHPLEHWQRAVTPPARLEHLLDWGNRPLSALNFVGSRKSQCRAEGLQLGTFQGSDPGLELWL